MFSWPRRSNGRSAWRIRRENDAWPSAQERADWRKVFDDWTVEQVAGLVGSWVMRSDDGGATWGEPVRVPVSSPHGPIRLRGGDLLYLGKPFGTWADMDTAQITAAGIPSFTIMQSESDDGGTWETDWILRSDGPDFDLGYPSTVELADGSLFTVCYQKAAKDEKCSLLWSKWKLPAADP